MVKKLKSFEELKAFSTIGKAGNIMCTGNFGTFQCVVITEKDVANQSTTSELSLLKDLQEGTEEEYLQHKPQSKP